MITAPAIPANLQHYSAEILAGLAAASRRRAELENAWGYPARLPAAIQKNDREIHITEPQPIVKQSNNNTAQPADLQAVKFWPLVGIAAARHNEGGAWRAWVLAKNLDKPGRGAIPLADLQALAGELGIHPKTWRRWLQAARRLTLIRDRASGDGWVVLASHQAAAVLLGCEYIGTRPASITAGRLTGEGWRAYVWAAYEQTHGGRPISRQKQEDISGVPCSTQRAYDNQANVIRRANYAISNRPIDELNGIKEFEGRAAPFEFYDHKRRRWVIAWRLPDSRTARKAESLQRGRSRKIRKAIKRLNYQRLNGLSILGQAASYGADDVQAWRLFHRTDRQARATERKLARADLKPPREIYIIRAARSEWHAAWRDVYGASLWDSMPQQGGPAL